MQAQPLQCREAVGHQSLSARFIDGRPRSICDDNAQTSLSRSNRCS
jgi:hypothetical protein